MLNFNDESLKNEPVMSSVRKHVLLPIIALGILSALAYIISLSKPDASQGKRKNPASLSIEAVTVSKQDFPIKVDSFGRVQAKTQTELLPLVGGQIIWVSPKFLEGGFFSKGDQLLRLEQADYLVELQIAKSNLATAELALYEEQARSEQARRDWLKSKKPELATELALRKPQLKSAEAALATAKAKLQLAELNLKRTTITAPYDGRVLKTFVDIGSVVGSGSVLATIYSSDRVEVHLPVSSKDLPFINLPAEQNVLEGGLDVTLFNHLTSPAEAWRAKATRSSAAVDETSQQVSIVAEINAPFSLNSNHAQALKIGQYVSAEIAGMTLTDAIVIANETVYQGSYVYTVVDEQIQRKTVQILWQNSDISVISHGLNAGDVLVTTSLGQVISGTPVSIYQLDGVEP